MRALLRSVIVRWDQFFACRSDGYGGNHSLPSTCRSSVLTENRVRVTEYWKMVESNFENIRINPGARATVFFDTAKKMLFENLKNRINIFYVHIMFILIF
jgi:hypothetical protein